MVSFKHFVECLTNAMLSSHNYPWQVFLQDPFTRSKVRRCLQGSGALCSFLLNMRLRFYEYRSPMLPKLSTLGATVEAQNYCTTVPLKIISVLLVLMMNPFRLTWPITSAMALRGRVPGDIQYYIGLMAVQITSR